jgi:hypothetical protein
LRVRSKGFIGWFDLEAVKTAHHQVLGNDVCDAPVFGFWKSRLLNCVSGVWVVVALSFILQ